MSGFCTNRKSRSVRFQPEMRTRTDMVLRSAALRLLIRLSGLQRPFSTAIYKTITRRRRVSLLPFHPHIFSAISGGLIRALTRHTVTPTFAIARKPTFACAGTAATPPFTASATRRSGISPSFSSSCCKLGLDYLGARVPFTRQFLCRLVIGAMFGYDPCGPTHGA
jgi:hypothetical protein